MLTKIEHQFNRIVWDADKYWEILTLVTETLKSSADPDLNLNQKKIIHPMDGRAVSWQLLFTHLFQLLMFSVSKSTRFNNHSIFSNSYQPFINLSDSLQYQEFSRPSACLCKNEKKKVMEALNETGVRCIHVVVSESER